MVDTKTQRDAVAEAIGLMQSALQDLELKIQIEDVVSLAVANSDEDQDG